MSVLFRRVIYIGPSIVKDWTNKNGTHPVFVKGAGWVTKSHVNFGMTGYAYRCVNDPRPNTKGKWDFRPDTMNVAHIVRRKDLKFVDKQST